MPSLSPEDAADLASWGALLFAPPNSPPGVLSPFTGVPGVNTVHCETNAAACESVGATTTTGPILVFANTRLPLPDAEAVTALAPTLATLRAAVGGLASRGATLYGRNSCVWTRRQLATLGPHSGRLPYVDCEVEPGKCGGVTAVPAWSLCAPPPSELEGGVAGCDRVRVLGMQKWPQLVAMSSAPEAVLREYSAATTQGR